MRVTLAGTLSLQLEDEWLYDGKTVPVVLRTEIDPSEIEFVENRARLAVDVPVDLKIAEGEWSRAIGEVLSREFRKLNA